MANQKIVVGWKRKRALVNAPITQHVEPDGGWKNTSKLTCPCCGTGSFGVMPELQIRGSKTLPRGDVFLLFGEHFAANSGYGFMHAWAEHFNWLKDRNQAITEVTRSVNSVLQPGTQVLIDRTRNSKSPPRPPRTGLRPYAFRINVGSVIMELIEPADNEAYYSIITCGFGSSDTKKGTLIGTL